jgi:hypothetical protein
MPRQFHSKSPRLDSDSSRRSNTSASHALKNLEMAGDHLKIYSLQTLLTNKRSPETRATARLGDVLLPWFDKVIHKPAEKLDGVTELWQSLVPVNLKDRSRLLGLVKGVLSVALDSATVRAELDARLRAGLLRQLQTESRGIVFRVKTCVQAFPGSSQS